MQDFTVKIGSNGIVPEINIKFDFSELIPMIQKLLAENKVIASTIPKIEAEPTVS
ncbi:MAG: hypothetical protein ABFD00_00780 [Chloroherpetonaceae bacterium]